MTNVTPSGHPIVGGRQQLTTAWAMTLPFPMAKRIEDGALVFWAPGGVLTLWLTVWGPSAGVATLDREERWRELIAAASPEVTARREDRDGAIWRLSYRLHEASGDKRVAAFYGYAIGRRDHLHFAAYFNDEVTAAEAERCFLSLAET